MREGLDYWRGNRRWGADRLRQRWGGDGDRVCCGRSPRSSGAFGQHRPACGAGGCDDTAGHTGATVVALLDCDRRTIMGYTLVRGAAALGSGPQGRELDGEEKQDQQPEHGVPHWFTPMLSTSKVYADRGCHSTPYGLHPQCKETHMKARTKPA